MPQENMIHHRTRLRLAKQTLYKLLSELGPRDMTESEADLLYNLGYKDEQMKELVDKK